MKTTIPEIDTLSKSKNQRTYIKVLLDNIDVTNQVLSIGGNKEALNPNLDLIKNQMNLTTSNINGNNESDPASQFSIDTKLAKKCKVETGYSDGTNNYSYVQDIGDIYSIETDEKTKTSKLTVIGSKILTKKLFSDDALYSMTPHEIVNWMGTLLGITTEIISKDVDPLVDEQDKIIDYIGYFDDDLFYELNQLCLFSQGRAIYDEDTQTLKYYTAEYLKDKDENAESDFTLSTDGSSDFLLLDTKENFKTSEIINRLEVNVYEYKGEKTGLKIGDTREVKVKVGESEEVYVKYNNNAYYIDVTTTNTIVKDLLGNTIAGNVDVTGINYIGGIIVTFINNGSEDILVKTSLIGRGLLPIQSTLVEEDQTSINENGIKVKKIDSKYFQNYDYAKGFTTAYFNTFKNSLKLITGRTTGLPQLELLDKVTFKDISKKEDYQQNKGLINKISWSYDISDGFLYNLELFNPIIISGGDLPVNFEVVDVYSNGNSYFVKGNNGKIYGVGRNTASQLGDGGSMNYTTPTQLNLLETNIVDIFPGAATFFLRNDGTVVGYGLNNYGQLGVGDTTHRSEYTIISGLSNIQTIVNQESYRTFFITSTGQVYGCGINTIGQLGVGDTINKTTPTLLSGISNVTKIFCNNDLGSSTFFLKTNGTFYSCGANNYGQLGVGDTTDRNTPVLVSGISNVSNVLPSQNDSFSFFFLTEAGLYGAGVNSDPDNKGYGSLGLGTLGQVLSPQQVISEKVIDIKRVPFDWTTNFYLLDDGTVKSTGYIGLDLIERSTPTLVSGLNNITRLHLGGQISNYDPFFLSGSGKVFYGKEAIQYLSQGVTDIITDPQGQNVVFFLRDDGSCIASGRNDYGQLGLGDTTNRDLTTISEVQLSDISKIYVPNYEYSLFLTSSKQLYSVGRNFYGQLGLGDTTNRSIPELISFPN